MSEIKVNKISPRTACGTVTLGDSGDSVTVTAGVPVTVNGDLKSNALKAVDGGSIISQCGTNITLGASGDTINLAAGASQTGFGRTGTVDWDTTAKTTNFNAVSGNGYFVNTSGGAVTMTLPASPSAGDIVAFKDYANTFDTNNLTVARNGSFIGGVAADAVISVEGQAVTMVYVDGTKGWLATYAATESDLPKPSFIAATGGTVTCCGDYKIHTFTGPGTFTVTCGGNASGSNSVDYVVVAGGGGGSKTCGGGGGGAGGYREGFNPGSYTASPLATTALPVTATGYPIVVGGGGTYGPACTPATDGSNSIFSTITSTGGGGAGGFQLAGRSGGSGGGGGAREPSATGGAGNTPPVSPPQGQPGGAAKTEATPANDAGGGGGGATAAGGIGSNVPAPAPPSPFGKGGDGATTSINGSSTTYAGGGGGGAEACGGVAGSGGSGGGGQGGGPYAPGNNGTAGTTNTGGGGGGARCAAANGGTGGSGIVIIRYKFQ
jgi:hypothetical protein